MSNTFILLIILFSHGGHAMTTVRTPLTKEGCERAAKVVREQATSPRYNQGVTAICVPIY